MAQKDVAFKIRVEEELRHAFINACRSEDRPAAQVVRQFMRSYVNRKKRQEIQPGLFDEDDSVRY